jgi:hypothetical protein
VIRLAVHRWQDAGYPPGGQNCVHCGTRPEAPDGKQPCGRLLQEARGRIIMGNEADMVSRGVDGLTATECALRLRYLARVMPESNNTDELVEIIRLLIGEKEAST